MISAIGHHPVRVMLAAMLAAVLSLVPYQANAVIPLRMQTDLGGVDIDLFDTLKQATVDNFMLYVNAGDYEGSFISRRASLDTSGVDVLQMGGYYFDPSVGKFTDNSGIVRIPSRTLTPLLNDPGLTNRRTTIAMARLSGQPDSATNEFYFNLVDNPTLDTTDGGFTVFGEVTRGMGVIDDISALDRCRDIGSTLPAPCFHFPDVPLVNIFFNTVTGSFTTPIEQYNLIHIVNIGTDSDRDGIIDKVEDAAPDVGTGIGDANQDFTQDSGQNWVTSFESSVGGYVTMVTDPAVAMDDTVVLGFAYLITAPDTNGLLSGVVFPEAIFGTTLHVGAAGGAASIEVTLPSATNVSDYFLYGPTAANPTPHWYLFDFDGQTGAVAAGNTVTLHFVDGERGDADLLADGVITKTPGAPARCSDTDGDCVADNIEDAVPGCDGNGDSICDSQQAEVTSLRDIRRNYVTLVSSSATQPFEFVAFSPFPANAGFPPFLAGMNFPNGFLRFRITAVPPGGAASVRLQLPAGETPDTYIMYGPEPGNSTNHFYDFSYDPATGTGAQITGNVVTLNFIDGGRGDADLLANGIITDPGAPAFVSSTTSPSSGGSGCSLQAGRTSAWQSGAWCLLALWMIVLRRRRYGTSS